MPASASATFREPPPPVISTVVEFPSPSDMTANVQVELAVATTEANLSRLSFIRASAPFHAAPRPFSRKTPAHT